MNYPNGMQVLYDYYGVTGDFLLKQIKNLSAGTTRTVISQFDYTYRQDRSIDTWTVNQGSGATTWSFGYDGAHQLTSAKRRDASQALLESGTRTAKGAVWTCAGADSLRACRGTRRVGGRSELRVTPPRRTCSWGTAAVAFLGARCTDAQSARACRSS